MALGVYEGTIVVDSLTMTLEIVKTREAALARRVGAHVGFRTLGVVR